MRKFMYLEAPLLYKLYIIMSEEPLGWKPTDMCKFIYLEALLLYKL